jgi:hypothetical protein
MFARLGGLYFIFYLLFLVILPCFILQFLQKLAKLILKKYDFSYRDGLNEIAKKTFTQLAKIKRLQSMSPKDWDFLGTDQIVLIDKFLQHA